MNASTSETGSVLTRRHAYTNGTDTRKITAAKTEFAKFVTHAHAVVFLVPHCSILYCEKMNQGRGGYYASSLHPAYQPFVQTSAGVVAVETPPLPARRQKVIPELSNDASKIDQILSLLQGQ